MSSAFVAAFCKRHPFSAAWVQQDGPANVKQQNQAVTDRRYSTADERSRARKSADNKDSNAEARFA